MSPALFLQIVTEVCLPLFLVVGFGWVMDRKFALNLETLVKINIYLLVPAFVFVRCWARSCSAVRMWTRR